LTGLNPHPLSRSQLKPPEHSAVGTGTGFTRCMARYKDGQRAKITIEDITCISRVTYEKCTLYKASYVRKYCGRIYDDAILMNQWE
jgi:hypothetical protein